RRSPAPARRDHRTGSRPPTRTPPVGSVGNPEEDARFRWGQGRAVSQCPPIDGVVMGSTACRHSVPHPFPTVELSCRYASGTQRNDHVAGGGRAVAGFGGQTDDGPMTPPSTHVVERGEDPDLTWTTSQHGQVGILTLAGCLDDSSAARVRAHIETWVQERPGQEGAIVLDLRQVYDLTVSALAILISPSQPDRLDLRLVAAPHPAFTVLQAHHSTAPLPLFHTPEAALAPELTEVQRLRSELDQRREQLAGKPAIEQAKGI